jgi:hypothetical protein
MATAQPQDSNGLRFDSDTKQLRVDNCLTASITNTIGDFVGKPKVVHVNVKGVGGLVQATHIGTVKWRLEDDKGVIHTILLPGSYLVPTMSCCLLSPQHWAQTANDHRPHPEGTGCLTTSKEVQLFWNQRKYTKTVPLDPHSNVATMTTAPGFDHFSAFSSGFDKCNPEGEQNVECFQTHVIPMEESDDEQSTSSTKDGDDISFQDPDPVETTPDNPDGMQKQSTVMPTQSVPTDEVQESERLGTPDTINIEFDDTLPAIIPDDPEPQTMSPQDELLRWHYRLGHISFARLHKMAKRGDLPRKLLDVKIPLCAACQYGKMTRKAWRSKTPNKQKKTWVATAPGQCVSVDQLESTTLGFIAQLKGKLTTQRYQYGTVFVDHYSRMTYIYLQKRLTSDETVQAKRAFERHCQTLGVKVRHYHADNGRFADNGFINHCKLSNQTISYCGVNAHWQNGIAEKKIRDLQEKARTMLLYANHKWPTMLSPSLWPYALRAAAEVENSVPLIKGELSPIELFTGVQVAPKLTHFHSLFCPVYVLDNKLQGGKSIPKWQTRSRLGINLGPSPNHSRSIALVLNPRTGHVSPQYHVKQDDFFETVSGKVTDFDSPEPIWKRLAGLDDLAPKLGKAKGKTTKAFPSIRPVREPPIQAGPTGVVPPIEPPIPPDEVGNLHVPPQPIPPINNPIPEPLPTVPQAQVRQAPPPTAYPSSPARVTRSGRVVKDSTRYTQSVKQRDQNLVAWEVLTDNDDSISQYPQQEEWDIQQQMEDPMAFATHSDPDTMYMHQAMKQPDKAEWLKAMDQEVNDHVAKGHWKLVPLAKVPKGVKVLDAVWAMRRKRKIMTGEIYKWKARLNAHGGQQVKGVNYWETYAPVVSWPTIRFFFSIALLRGWETRQIDFVQAYPQAPVECDIYMDIPKGYKIKGVTHASHVIKLIKNLYGQKQAGRVWNKHLEAGLMKIGFQPSKIDPCLYYKGQVVFLVYVDDGIFLSPSKKAIDKAIQELREADFDVEDQGDICDYLGVRVDKTKDGKITLTQPQLIKSIIGDMHFQDNTKERDTPALSSKILNKDRDGPSMEPTFHYRRVIGKLNFLEKSTRPDIAYSVHQCARFCEDPKESHSQAVKNIVRYLKATKDQGMILNPQLDKSFDCYVDSDFCGLWNRANAMMDPSTSKSRTGYVICYAGCPIIWASKLQTQTALSTTEAEYVALSTALREQIPLMELLKEIRHHGIDVQYVPPQVHCKVFEDNSGAIELARLPKIRPRTKHINNTYHHFREYVARGEIQVLAIATEDQPADLLTKPLAVAAFLQHRKFLQGW